MVIADFLEQLKHFSTSDRLIVIEAATRLIRDDIRVSEDAARRREDEQMRAAAERLKDLYEPGSEHTEWTVLDGEEVLDDTVPG